MKKFVVKLLFLLPILVLFMGINYVEDPANIFHKGPYEMGIIKYLMEGKNVTNVTNYDERLLQKYYIENMKQCPSTIILGSSRVMQLGSGFFKNEHLMNNGVSGASIEDLLAIYNLYETKGCEIKKIRIGLDPYFLNDNNDQSRWRVLSAEYNNCLQKIGLEKYADRDKIIESKYSRYKELWSLSYFKNSLGYLIRGVDVHYRPTTDSLNKDFTKMVDGSIFYSEVSRNSSLEVVNGYAVQSINESPMYSMREFKQLSVKYKTIFTTFISYLQQKNIEVELFISPYHPIVYDYISKENSPYKIVFEAEKYFNAYAAERHITLIGTYNPYVYHFKDSSFYDGFHCKEGALKSIIDGNMNTEITKDSLSRK